MSPKLRKSPLCLRVLMSAGSMSMACAGAPAGEVKPQATQIYVRHEPAFDAEPSAEAASDLPPEVEAMLEPRTCSPNLLSASHLQEFKDSRGGRHRAVLIKPGEQLCLVSPGATPTLDDLELSDDPVPLERANGRLISLQLARLETASVLVVKNHHQQTLQYRAGTRLPHQLDLVSANTCPVKPGKFGLERWADPIEAVVLMDLELHERGEGLSCN